MFTGTDASARSETSDDVVEIVSSLFFSLCYMTCIHLVPSYSPIEACYVYEK